MSLLPSGFNSQYSIPDTLDTSGVHVGVKVGEEVSVGSKGGIGDDVNILSDVGLGGIIVGICEGNGV